MRRQRTKFYFLLIGGLLFTKTIKSQNYQAMLNQRAEWHLTWCDESCKSEIYYTDGDTTHNGQVYKVLNGFHYISREFWLREDIQDQKVWLSLKIDSKRQEYLLYNFSVQVGDSVAMYNPISPFPLNGGTYVVDSIVSKLLLDGQYHRFYYFSPSASVQYPQYPIWVEGLGSLSLINAPGGTPNWFNHGRISCYFKENGQVYEDLDTISSCNVRYLSTASPQGATNDPSVQIQYTGGSFVIWLHNLDQYTYRFTLWDAQGKKIGSSSFKPSDSQYEMPFKHLGRGYYTIRLQTVAENREYIIPFVLPSGS